MKAFVIFPTICILLLTMTLLTMDGRTNRRATLFWAAVLAALFGGFMTWFSVDAFPFLYYSNFLGIFVCIPCLTYLTNRFFSKTEDKKINWVRLLGLGMLSTVVTVATAGFLILMSFIFNPMDPPTSKISTEETRVNNGN